MDEHSTMYKAGEGRVCALVLAAGRGTRMKSRVPKQFMDLCGKPVIYYSLKAFEDSEVDDIILVTGRDSLAYCREQIVDRFGFGKVRAVVEGGEQRYDSVMQGIRACRGCGCLLIHDGARPMLTRQMIDESIEGARRYGACVMAVPSKDTVKIADGDGFAQSTPDRSRVWLIQTPQSFDYDLIRSAYEAREEAGWAATDDASVVERYTDVRVKLIMGDYRNIKITTPEDIRLAESFIDGR